MNNKIKKDKCKCGNDKQIYSLTCKKCMNHSTNLGKKFSISHKTKMSKSRKLWYIKNKLLWTKEVLPKIITPERNKKLSIKLKGRIFSKNHKLKISGVNNSNWKGDKVSYKSLHEWLRNNKPRVYLCEICNKNKSQDIANISRVYTRNFEDYIWACKSCHSKFDKAEKNFYKEKNEKN